MGQGHGTLDRDMGICSSRHALLNPGFHLGVSILLGTHRYPHLIRCWLRRDWEFAIGLPEMKWSPLRIRGVQGGSGRVVCDIPIGRDDTGRSAVWVLYREWLYRRKIGRNSGQILQKLE